MLALSIKNVFLGCSPPVTFSIWCKCQISLKIIRGLKRHPLDGGLSWLVSFDDSLIYYEERRLLVGKQCQNQNTVCFLNTQTHKFGGELPANTKHKAETEYSLTPQQIGPKSKPQNTSKILKLTCAPRLRE